MKKDFGGLGIPNLRELNTCLLGSWIKTYYDGGRKLWKDIVNFKYNSEKPNIFNSSVNNSSIFWKGVMSVAQAVKFEYRWKVGDDNRIRFWEDTWFGSSPFAVQFWPLYTICN